MGNWCSSSRKEPASSVTMVHRENPKKALTERQLTGVMVASEYNTMVLGASSNGEIPANSSSSSGRGSFGKEPKVPTVLLLPHQHTLFCERKQRVCTAVGRCQELEKLKLAGLDLLGHEWVWFRSPSADIFATKDKRRAATVLAGSENQAEYQLTREDVGHYVGVVYGPLGACPSVVDEEAGRQLAANTLGPVLPGPPRVLSFTISGDAVVGGYAQAQTQYIGGSEGRSEFWWLRISPDGKRSQVTEPRAVPEAGSAAHGDPAADPRFYRLTAADVGCTLKAKCRPTRTDGAQGEIFTSKSSDTVRAP